MYKSEINLQIKRDSFASENNFNVDRTYIEILDIDDNQILKFKVWRYIKGVTYNYKNGWVTQVIMRSINEYIKDSILDNKKVEVCNISDKLGINPIKSHINQNIALLESCGYIISNIDDDSLTVTFNNGKENRIISLYSITIIMYFHSDVNVIKDLIHKYSSIWKQN